VSVIAFDRVTLAIGGEAILAGVSLAIEPGQFVGVLGPNGSGKTTLMRAILGLLTPTAGALTVFGRPPARGSATIGYMPQTRSDLPTLRLTGRDFLASSLHGHRWGLPVPSTADAREIDRVIDLVGVRDLAGRPLNELSGGERQRLLLAQALMGDPRLLLLDEPLISLDPRQQHAVVELIRRLAEELHLTVLFSAHELNQLLTVIDRVLYLGNRQAALGTVDDVATPQVLSRLYGSPIDVVRVAGRIFIMSGDKDVEHENHGPHEHGHDHARL